MAMDTLTGTAGTPCDFSTIEQLDKMLHEIYDGHDADLKHFVRRTDSDDIRWTAVRHLRIVGNAGGMCSSNLKGAGLPRGFYSNADGSWLLIITVFRQPERYVKQCGTDLESLWIHAADMPTLPGLENLTQLTSLNLRGCESLTKLPGLESLTQLTSLNLSWCSSLTELPGLEKLTQLTSLNLSRCESLPKLPGLENLIQLTSLNLSECKSLTELPGLKKLTQLTSLNLSFCYSLTELPGLEKLTQLTSLKLLECNSLAELPGLEKLTQLTSLDLSFCKSLTELPGLEKLTQLTSLKLSDCSSLTELPGLEKLTQLTTLELHGCKYLAKLPGLENMTHLTSLDLTWCISLTALPGLEKLTQLTLLELSDCSSLTELPGLENLTQLTSLDLSWCISLAELPEGIQHLKSLRRLRLCNLMLRDLPDWLPEIAEGFACRRYEGKTGRTKAIVDLYGTTVEAIPDMSIFDQPYEMVAKWFEERTCGNTHPLNEIKVVFLGDGEAGKTHTIARLMNDGGAPVDYVDSSTPGIVIRNKEYDLEDRKITVHYWDFGGQEIMHSMHRIFLTGRTMYVVLLNARDDTQGDRARYWLHNIQSFAPGTPVLLVLNKIDQNENSSVNETDLRSRYEKLTQVVRLSAKDFSQEEFINSFTKILLKEIQKTGFLDAEWPITWTKVKEKLENMEHHYIMGSDYQALCQECKVDDNQKNLLHWFNDLGVSFCYEDEGDEFYALENYVILRPDWITNALYIILFNPLEGARNGLIPHRSIYTLLESARNNPAIRCTMPEAEYNSGDIGYVLGIMRKFGLSFTDGHGREFIPMLCQQNSMVDIQYYEKDTETLEFNMEFDYLPNNLLHRLMVERHNELDMDTVWRTGARFENRGTGYSAVVVIDDTILRFFVRSSNSTHRPNTYLTMLKDDVDRIVAEMGLKAPICWLVYKLDGRRDVFDFEMLKDMQSIGQTLAFSRQWKRMIPIADILNQSAPANLQKCTKSTADPKNVHNYYGPVTVVQGNQYNHVLPKELAAILDKLITENIQTEKAFAERLLSQLESSKDEAAQARFVDDLLPQLETSEDKDIREIVEEAQKDPQKKRNLLTSLRKIIGGVGSATSFLADAPNAVQTLATITTAVTTVAAQYGPEIAEFLSKIRILPI